MSIRQGSVAAGAERSELRALALGPLTFHVYSFKGLQVLSRLALTASLAPLLTPSTVIGQQLAPPDVIVTEVTDSLGDVWYRYRVTNAHHSGGSIAAILLDISATGGTGTELLPAVGAFLDLSSSEEGAADHVPLGPVTPESWRAMIDVEARLRWSGERGRMYDLDSIPPGYSVEGFGVRSSFLPGVRTVWVEPTWQSCCSQPRGSLSENPDRIAPSVREFRAEGFTVGPTHAPAEMGLRILMDQVVTVCDSLRWGDPSICHALRQVMEEATSRAESSEPQVAIESLEEFLALLEESRNAGLSDNAFWMLKANAEHILGTFGSGRIVS